MRTNYNLNVRLAQERRDIQFAFLVLQVRVDDVSFLAHHPQVGGGPLVARVAGVVTQARFRVPGRLRGPQDGGDLQVLGLARLGPGRPLQFAVCRGRWR